MSDVTLLLNAVADGDPPAANELLPLVYDQLRKLAAYKMSNESPDHTLQATALVHESYLRLIGNDHPTFANRKHFFASAAEAMRRLLVDHARKKRSLKRGGDLEKVPLDAIDIESSLPSDELLAVHEALDKLEQENKQAAELVKLRYFAGLKQKDIAGHLDISPRSADNLWYFARAWLFR